MLKILAVALLIVLASGQFEGPEYELQTRQQKSEQLWAEINNNPKSGAFPGIRLAGIFLESMSPTFDHVADTLPKGRTKYIHSVGVVAQAEFISEGGHSYTGGFEGDDSLLIRLSVAKDQDTSKTTPKGAFENFTPGLGLKFLRNSVASGNLVAMYGVNGFESWNFFFKDASNHIPEAQGIALKFLSTKFSSATPRIGAVGLKDIAEYNQKGELINEPKFPFQLIFKAGSAVKNLFPDTYEDGYINQLQRVPAGVVLYEVYAIEAPNACEVKIGTIRTTSKFVTSKFGDERLFFRHGRVEYDLKQNPSWDEYIDKFSFFGGRRAKVSKCPFGF